MSEKEVFRECKHCAGKPNDSTLCEPCISNRLAMRKQEREIRTLIRATRRYRDKCEALRLLTEALLLFIETEEVFETLRKDLRTQMVCESIKYSHERRSDDA